MVMLIHCFSLFVCEHKTIWVWPGDEDNILVHSSLSQLWLASPQRRVSVTPAGWSAGMCTRNTTEGIRVKEGNSLLL